MSHACPNWMLAADAHFLKLLCLQNRGLRATDNLDRRTPVGELRAVFKIHCVYVYKTNLFRKQADVNQIQLYGQLKKKKQYKGSTRGLNFAAVKPTTTQVLTAVS
jgi:hypothetical protein